MEKVNLYKNSVSHIFLLEIVRIPYSAVNFCQIPEFRKPRWPHLDIRTRAYMRSDNKIWTTKCYKPFENSCCCWKALANSMNISLHITRLLPSIKSQERLTTLFNHMQSCSVNFWLNICMVTKHFLLLLLLFRDVENPWLVIRLFSNLHVISEYEK